MPNTALVWIIAYCAGLFLSFFQPFFGMLVYLLDYYAHPPLRWWGKALPDLRWSLLAAIVILTAYFVHGRSLLDSKILQHRQTKWLIGFLVVALLVTPFAVSTGRSLHYLEIIAKLTLLYFLIVGTVRTPQHFRWFVLAMIIGGLLWGVDAFLDPSRQAGRLRQIGGPDSYNDNSTASHLLTALPFIGAYFLIGKTWERALCLIAAPFVLNTIVLCNSRGATVAIGMAAVAGLILANGRFRVQLLLAMSLGGLLFFSLMDPSFTSRQLSLTRYAEDNSATERIESWKGAINLIMDYPLGTGGGGFDVLSPIYIADIVERHDGQERAVHNTFLWVASDWGLIGLICFLGFLFETFRELHLIRRTTEDRRLYIESFAIEIALIAFLGTAIFINRPYAEVLYWLAGLTAALRNIQLEQAVGHAPATTNNASLARQIEPVTLNS